MSDRQYVHLMQVSKSMCTHSTSIADIKGHVCVYDELQPRGAEGGRWWRRGRGWFESTY